MRGFLSLVILSALGALTTPALAAGGSIWDHNGSKMTLEENGEHRKLVYKELREGLDKAGIRAGTVLFNGERKPNGRLAGFAKIFKGTCNPVDYFVEGTLNEAKGEIVLQGQAPVYASGTSCEVTGYSDSSPASTLKFAKISDAPESAAVASRAPEPQIEQGDGGVTNDYLPPARPNNQSASRNPQDQSASRNFQDGQSYQPPRTDPQTGALPPRYGTSPNAEQDRNRSADVNEDADRDYWPGDRLYRRDPYAGEDRRYSRAPDPNEDRPYRRRPDAWDPDDEMAPDEEDGYYDDRRYVPRVSPFWGRRGW
jgi:hypothetical protein